MKFTPSKEPKIRTFYVDAALSKNKDSTLPRYWRCSVVENGQRITDFTDLTTTASSSTAESYTIFKTVELLTQQNYQGPIQIFTDVSSFNENNTLPYLQQAQALAKQNNIDLIIRWVKGSANLADYFSRQNISPERTNDPCIPKLRALLNNFDCLNITLNITLHKTITSRVINRISKNLLFIQQAVNNEAIDLIWAASELKWALTTLLEKTNYIPEEKEKQKLKKIISDLEKILKIE